MGTNSQHLLAYLAPISTFSPRSALDSLNDFMAERRKNGKSVADFGAFEAKLHERVMGLERELLAEELAIPSCGVARPCESVRTRFFEPSPISESDARFLGLALLSLLVTRYLSHERNPDEAAKRSIPLLWLQD